MGFYPSERSACVQLSFYRLLVIYFSEQDTDSYTSLDSSTLFFDYISPHILNVFSSYRAEVLKPAAGENTTLDETRFEDRLARRRGHC